MPDEQTNDFSGGALTLIDQVAQEGWRRKLGRIAFQLIAGSSGGVEVYAKARERVDDIEAKATVTKMIAEAVGRNALSDPAIMERAKARFLSDALRGQENVEAVFKASLPHIDMESDPPEDQATEPLDQDWADSFAKQAEVASSDDLRQRLGKILAGEIKKKGSYPRSVVRQIVELEKEEILYMQEACKNVVDNMLYTSPNGKDSLSMKVLLSLSAEGLISDAGAGLTINKTIDPNGATFYKGNNWSLVVRGVPGTKFSHPVLSLSKTGHAVSKLIGPFDERPLLRLIADGIEKDNLTTIEIVQLLPIDNERFSIVNAESIYTKQ